MKIPVVINFSKFTVPAAPLTLENPTHLVLYMCCKMHNYTWENCFQWKKVGFGGTYFWSKIGISKNGLFLINFNIRNNFHIRYSQWAIWCTNNIKKSYHVLKSFPRCSGFSAKIEHFRAPNGAQNLIGKKKYEDGIFMSWVANTCYKRNISSWE